MFSTGVLSIYNLDTTFAESEYINLSESLVGALSIEVSEVFLP